MFFSSSWKLILDTIAQGQNPSEMKKKIDMPVNKKSNIQPFDAII